MGRIWAIGDIHGEAAKLDALLQALPREAGDFTVFLGDYIDRGPDSAAVLRRVLAEYDSAPHRTILLWGNHEDMAAEHFGFPAPSEYAYDPYDWFRNGGTEALESFGLRKPDLFAAPCPAEMDRLFPLLRLHWQATDSGEGDPLLARYLFVHAGVMPEIPLERQTAETFLWVRGDFLKSYDPSGRVVVHGHTPFDAVRVQPDKIGIDTGAAYGGRLTALELPARRVYQAGSAGSVIIEEIPEVDATVA